MKKAATLIILLTLMLGIAGCYTPPGGSSIPWNEPTQEEGNFNPRMNF